MFLRFAAVAATTLGVFVAESFGDEGMWLYNAPPVKQLAERYRFDAPPAWFEHAQKSAIRFNSGGTGSFVSADGLIITNHHVGAGELQKLSDEHHDYVRDGFLAASRAEEKKCLNLELNVLMEIEDVTDKVNAAVKAGMPAEEAFRARRAVTAAIEKESQEKTGLRSDVVTLYEGGEYHLYRYKKYTDVRLVFAPEVQAAFFGGDPDNFEFPRFNLDICLFRAYENGQPAHPEHYLKWSKTGAVENDLVFVCGNPGRTDRQLTVSDLEYQRDVATPRRLSHLNRLEVLLSTWSERSDENARRAKRELFGIQNSRKAMNGRIAGLLDPELMAGKKAAEQKLKDAVAQSADHKDALGAWDQIRAAQEILSQTDRAETAFEHTRGFDSKLFGIARTLLRAAEEKSKPNGDRLREFRDSNRESLELGLFSEEPIYNDLETVTLADSLEWLEEEIGVDNPLVASVVAGKAPRERAVELIKGTKLADVTLRKKLYASTPEQIAAAHDPMIELARVIDPESRRLRKIAETQDEVKRQAYAKIAAARFAIEKGATYPDATFTLRLAFGTVKGYEEEGRQIPFQTTFEGFFTRSAEHHNAVPFDLPARWVERKDKIDMKTPFNFVSTADIIGGNSGSPVLNRAGEFVGIIFDGNIQSLVLDYAYTDKQARAVSVCSQAITEALRKIYDAPALADELSGKK